MCSKMRALNRIICFSIGLTLTAAAHAQLGHEIARKHAARAGDRLAALTGLRAEGRTFINDEVVPFTMIAKRPNRLRVESFTPRRRAVEVYDGTNPPWVSHTEVRGGRAQDMNAAEAKEFIANADFDGPLVDFAAKGYSVDYAGEEKIEGRAAYKLLLMDKHDDIFFLWVDAENYEIVKRTSYRVSGSTRVAVETVFKDFRPVGGVLQPHRIETTANGHLLYITLIDRMEANPPVMAAETFARPVAPPP
jgi:outer membrane lipoprotein-sorting protein